ncbi:hypothetical protein ACLOJK_005132 [Asimina triloba]
MDLSFVAKVGPRRLESESESGGQRSRSVTKGNAPEGAESAREENQRVVST